jgi:hypothetical protein
VYFAVVNYCPEAELAELDGLRLDALLTDPLTGDQCLFVPARYPTPEEVDSDVSSDGNRGSGDGENGGGEEDEGDEEDGGEGEEENGGGEEEDGEMGGGEDGRDGGIDSAGGEGTKSKEKSITQPEPMDEDEDEEEYYLVYEFGWAEHFGGEEPLLPDGWEIQYC